MIFAIAGVALLAMLFRPFRISEAWFASGGALLLVLTGLVPLGEALSAVRRGTDVYAFLIGMMLLAEILSTQGVFARLASLALRAAGDSQPRLFGLVFGAGTAVTIFFSNDATAVVLTRAVAAMLSRVRVSPYPYLFACAFVANAASFVLPISNPANLVVFGGGLPRLGAWLAAFAWPSLAALTLTFCVVAGGHRRSLRPRLPPDSLGVPEPSAGERVASIACGLAALGMVAASVVGAPLGAVTLALGVAALLTVALVDRAALRTVPRGVSYAIVPLVAGLFVIVEALDRAGLLSAVRGLLVDAGRLGGAPASLGVGFAVAAASNAINNLPVALGLASAFAGSHPSESLRHAALVGVDLGPNLAVSGSLATLLWMEGLRRENVAMSGPRFLRSGLVVTVPALAAALLVVR